MTLEEGLQRHRAGEFAQAEAIYRQVLQENPRHPDALHLLGVLAHQCGNSQAALQLINQAIETSPSEKIYYRNAAEAYLALGGVDKAIECLQKAIELQPDFDAYYSLGSIYQKYGRLGEAQTCYEQALAFNPQAAETHTNLGVILQNQERLEEAISHYNQAIQIKPEDYRAYNNLANVLKTQGRLEEAIHQYEKALILNPDYDLAHNNLANVFNQQGKFEEARRHFEAALYINPNNAVAHNNYGNMLILLGRVEEAISHFEFALAENNHYEMALNNLGNALSHQGRVEEAMQKFKEVLADSPNNVEASNNLGNLYKEQGLIEAALEAYSHALDSPAVFGNWMYTEQFLPNITQERLYETHSQWDEKFAAPFRTEWGNYSNNLHPDKKLTLGFVSGDFRIHPVGFFIIRVLEKLSQDNNVICYANQYVDDDFTQRFKKTCAAWRNIYGLNHQQVAEQIRQDQVDILFDLTGHNAGNRLLVFARKPAPIQITWAGYMATTGVQAMDYLIGDPYETPIDCDAYYTEKIIRMPHSFICYEPYPDMPEPNLLPALKNGYVTFGSFNILAKITPMVVETWAKILKALPDSKLVLKASGFNCDKTKQRYLDMFETHGISADRISCRCASSRDELWLEYQQVDIQLDPFPFSGSTTTLESLWMGVPVLTLPQETFASRHSFSYLSNIGLTDFVASDVENYIQIATAWSHRLEELSRIRQDLRTRMAESPLCDAETFGKELYKKLREVWQTYVSDNK